jgi:hypothetical protein
MKRRGLLTGLGGVAITAPVAGHAQQNAIPMIGVLSAGSSLPDFSPEPRPPDNDPFHNGTE